MPKNTYIFAPNHSTTPSVDIQLGHILVDISDFVPINNDVVPIEYRNEVDRKHGFTMRRARLATSKLGIFGQIFTQMGVGIDVGINTGHDRPDILSVNCLDTESFDPTDAYIAKTIKLPEIALFLADTHHTYPLFLVTGLKLARDRIALQRDRIRKLNTAISPPATPVADGVDGTDGDAIDTSEIRLTEIILGLRLLKIAFRHGQLRQAPYMKRAVMLSGYDSDSDGTDRKPSDFMVSDVSVEDVDNGKVQIEEVDYGDDDNVWLIPVAQYRVGDE